MTTFDLHVHTTASDGLLAPYEVVCKAKTIGLKAIAITDHDTTAGLEEAIRAGQEQDILVIPGIELSADLNNAEIHILGYFMDYNNPQFQANLAKFRNDRIDRAKKMVQILNSLNYDITFEEVLKYSNDGTVGRPHVAQALLSKGLVSSMSEAFEKLLSKGRPAYVPREKITPHEAVKLIRKFHGIPVIAHPGIADGDHLIPELVDVGLLGIEVYHPEHGLQDTLKYLTLAKTHGLLVTGGSDFHGSGTQTKGNLGVANVDFSIVSILLKAKENLENAISG